MKGIAHFISGVAVATFFPQAVQAAAQDLSFVLVLGGIGGILPDTLDFKLARYFERVDYSVDPDPTAPDPQAMAETLARAMERAFAGEPVTVQLHTMKLGADLWRQYRVFFDAEAGEVIVRIGPLVTTAQVPYPASEPAALGEGRASVRAPMRPTYDAEVVVDIFSGPALTFQRRGDAVDIIFLPWHRRWSHSLLLALGLGLLGALLSPLHGLVLGLGALVHILEDQLGHMGSNLFFPLTRRRIPGFQLLRSGDALPNFFTVWLSLVLIVFNLDRFSATPLLNPLPYFLITLLVPWALILGANWLLSRGRAPRTAEAIAVSEVLEEAVEIE
ncbi:MAG: metal-dependent hydrolase [Anaerolineae bacterium]|nr:metal-dependent hydrolase [Anaerolineae bacterium]